jgi:hypothetical protein
LDRPELWVRDLFAERAASLQWNRIAVEKRGRRVRKDQDQEHNFHMRLQMLK